MLHEGRGSNYAVSNRYQIPRMIVSLSEDSLCVQCGRILCEFEIVRCLTSCAKSEIMGIRESPFTLHLFL
jgi:hypothetical protein